MYPSYTDVLRDGKSKVCSASIISMIRLFTSISIVALYEAEEFLKDNIT